MSLLCGFGVKLNSTYSERVKTIHSKRHKRLVEAIIAKRKGAGIRQVQLAKKLKRSQTWIARLESGERRIDVIELIELANAIGFDASAIVAEVQQGKK